MAQARSLPLRSELPRWLPWSWLLAFGIYVLLAVWASRFTLDAPPVPMIWPATGVALAMLYRFGFGTAVPLFLAGVVVQMVLGVALPQAVILSAGALAGAAVGAWLLGHYAVRPQLDRVRDVFLLVLVGVGASAAISGLTGTLTAVGVSSAFPATLGLCWLADTMGVLLFAPALLALRVPSGRLRAMAASIPLVLLPPTVVYLAFAGGIGMGLALPLSYMVFPAVMLLGLWLRPGSVALSVALAALVAVTCTAAGKGPFAQTDMQPDLISLHVQLALLQLTGLLLAAVRCERMDAERRERIHLRTLARIGRLNAMSAMAAGLAHEMNQPLCAVSSYAQTARRMLARGASPAALADTLERIVEGVERASAIVRRTRRFLQADDGQRRAHDLHGIVREALSLMRPELRRSGIRVHMGSESPPLPVMADALELQQVLVNLFQNAEEALVGADRAGGDRWISVRCSRVAGARQAQLQMIDNGPGLPAGEAVSLFEPLVSHRQGGTGLGLAIARSIVEAHGGKLTAGNTAGAGACFTIVLPLVEEKVYEATG